MPRARLWSAELLFDWRDAALAEGIAASVFSAAMRDDLPAERRGDPASVPSAQHSVATALADRAELARPEPDRCVYGRGLLGCLAGWGVQRDRDGAELEGGARVEPLPPAGVPVWIPPVDFDGTYEASLARNPAADADAGSAGSGPGAPPSPAPEQAGDSAGDFYSRLPRPAQSRVSQV